MEDKLIIKSESDKLSLSYKKSSVLLIIISAVVILSLTYINGFDVISILDAVIFLLVIDIIFICYLGLFRDKVFAKSYAWWIIVLSYVISIFCMIPNIQGSNIPYWILGGVILACIIDLNTGILMTYSLTVLTAWVCGQELKLLVMHLIICTLLCILTRFLRNFIQLLYINVIIICIEATLLLAVASFNIKEAFSKQGIILMLYCIFVTILCYVLKQLEEKYMKLSCGKLQDVFFNEEDSVDELNEDKNDDDYVTDNLNIDLNNIFANTDGFFNTKDNVYIDLISTYEYAVDIESIDLNDILKDSEGNIDMELNYINNTIDDVEKIDSIDSVDFELDALKAEFEQEKKQEENEFLYNSLMEIIDINNELLIKMKNEYPNLYRHGKKVAILSMEAAKAIEADELIAYAGGLYHDVGKLVGKDVIEEGIKLVNGHSFPECIKDIIKQSNIKSENPKSREAAIIMLTDNILAVISFFKKQGISLSIEKVVEKTLDIRLSKGVLDESGLSKHDFNLLKRYYKRAIKS